MFPPNQVVEVYVYTTLLYFMSKVLTHVILFSSSTIPMKEKKFGMSFVTFSGKIWGGFWNITIPGSIQISQADKFINGKTSKHKAMKIIREFSPKLTIEHLFIKTPSLLWLISPLWALHLIFITNFYPFLFVYGNFSCNLFHELLCLKTSEYYFTWNIWSNDKINFIFNIFFYN